MACGIHLGILLVCLVQAEHVCCSWATEAQGSQHQYGNRYVGFSQQDSGLRRFGGSYPQDEFRQDPVSLGSGHSSSHGSQAAVSRGFNNRLSSSSYAHTVSQLPQSGYPSVGSLQSGSLSNPNWRTNAEQTPARRKSLGLSTDIASASSVNKFPKALYSESRTGPVQQGTSRTIQYMPGGSASPQSPSRERSVFTSSSHQSAAHNPSGATARTPAHFGQRSSSPPRTSFPSHEGPVRMYTSARGRARKVNKAPKASSFSPLQNVRGSYDPGQALAKPYQNKPLVAAGVETKGSYKPTSMASNYLRYAQSPEHYKQNAFNAEPRGVKLPYSSDQVPRSSSGGSAQGAYGTGTSAQLFAPTETHSIPQRFGGFAIRRLKGPNDQAEAGVRRLSAPSQQAAAYTPQAPSVHQESKWKRVRLPNWQSQVPQEQ